MLKGIPSIISPELLKILMEMGHGDEIVIGDGNFPAQSMGQRVVRLDGHGVPEILEAVLSLMPLDQYVERPVALMSTTQGDPEPPIWDTYAKIVKKYEGKCDFDMIERFAFYGRTKLAYAIIATGESEVYANVILKKGVIVN